MVISVSMALAVVVSFAAALFITPKFIRFLEAAGITGKDIQKRERPTIAEMGGPAVLTGFLAGIFFYIWVKVFLYGEVQNMVELFAGITTILIITIIGMFDDLSGLVRRNKIDNFGNLKRIGLKQWQKPLLTLPAAIPLMAIMAGDTSLTVPLLGSINIGIFYPLLIVPIAIIGASNATNMLAGMNGLEAGLGAVLLTTLGIYGYIHNSIAAAMIAFTFAAALLGFLWFNKYPAKIMPGDSVPYAIGAAVAVVAIIGNMEKFALYVFALWFVEFALKARSGFRAESFGVLQPDGTLKAPYPKIYSLTHAVMKLRPFTEKQVVMALVGLQVLIGAAVFLLMG
jgi:UDP-N-acetylglucosamine--dolichyl-phosphate N-acetylglucosaminephosphotransferase